MQFEHPSRYIAHRHGMLFLKEIRAADDKSLQATADITEHHFFYDKNLDGVPAWAGIEIMAQACASWTGVADLKEGREPELGFLLGARTYTAHEPVFKKKQCLVIDVKVELLAAGTMVFNGSIADAFGNLLVEGDITAFRPDNLSDYLTGEVQW